MDIRDIMMEPTGIERPDHPDFWILSETILALKADKDEFERGKIDMATFEERWKAHYEKVGDFNSIAYHATQCGMAIYDIKTAEDWRNMMRNPARHTAYVSTVQGFFDGFIMGAALERRRHEESAE